MKVLLSHGYFLEEDAAEQKIMMPYPPQGLLHLQAYLARHQIPSAIFDTTFSSFDEMASRLRQARPDILGLYCNLVTRINIVKILRFIREEKNLEGTLIVLGGPDVRHHREEYLSAGADVCVIGEGEEALRELIDWAMERLGDWAKLKEMKGIAFKVEGEMVRRDVISTHRDEIYASDNAYFGNFSDEELVKRDVISTPDRPFIKNLDSLPFPDFDQVPVEKYLYAWKKHHGYTSLTFSTMRGCPYSCRWCSKAVFGNTYRRRSPAPVVTELARLKAKYGPDQYWFVDDVFTISKKWLQEFRDELRKQQVAIRYECITRADTMDDETIRLLVDTGCRRLWIGAESGSQKVLDRMDRRVKAEQVREMIIKSREAGIETGTFLMLGYPGETLEDIRETLRHLQLSLPDLMTLTMAYPIKGTAFYEEVASGLRIKGKQYDDENVLRGPWETYSDRELEYPRPYPDRFYKHAVRFIYHGYRAAISRKKNGWPISLRFMKHWLVSASSLLVMKSYKKNEIPG